MSERSREAELMRSRAEAFMKYARSGLESGDYDFACFAAEQAAHST